MRRKLACTCSYLLIGPSFDKHVCDLKQKGFRRPSACCNIPGNKHSKRYIHLGDSTKTLTIISCFSDYGTAMVTALVMLTVCHSDTAVQHTGSSVAEMVAKLQILSNVKHALWNSFLSSQTINITTVRMQSARISEWLQNTASLQRDTSPPVVPPCLVS